MADRLSDKLVKAIPAPQSGNRIVYDADLKGFGVRVTSAGARAFILNYRTAAGRERRITIGSHPEWTDSKARDRAEELKRRVDDGFDPMGERHEERAAPTVDELAARFEAEHLVKRRTATTEEYCALLRKHILPRIGRMKVADVRYADVEKLHREITKAGAAYRANRAVSVVSKMMSLAIRWEMRSDNPAQGVERNPEQKRERFLSAAEIARLEDAMAAYPDRAGCDAIRLLLLTGARRGEALSATWAQFDLEKGIWTKPSAATKQGTVHVVPLSAPALVLLTQLRAKADSACPFVFPGEAKHDAKGIVTWQPLGNLKRTWLAVCIKAGLAEQVQKRVDGKPVKGRDGKPVMVWEATARIHDLRHSFASMLAGGGSSLLVIGKLLGHTQAATTQRYAHLADDPLRAATERAGAFIVNAGKPTAEVLQIKRAG